MNLKFMYITNKKEIAIIAQKAGVDRIFIDLEKLGKNERQKNMNTVKSEHSFEDIKKIKPLLTTSELLVRIDPMNINTKNQIEKSIEYGADLIMLPMFRTSEEVKDFIDCVSGRVKTILLLETKDAVDRLDEILSLDGIDEIHIGLNDLHISYGQKFMFELLANGTVEKICSKIKCRNIPYGFGGIAKIGEGLLPAENIITEHFRLGSSRVILSRSFCECPDEKDKQLLEREFEAGIRGIKNWEKVLEYVNLDYFSYNKNVMHNIVNKICNGDKSR